MTDQVIMKTRTAALVAVVGLAVLAQGLLVSTQSGSTDPAYVITDLGTFGGDNSFAGGINEFGQVAGAASRSDGTQHAFFYDGTLHDLGTIGGPNSGGFGVNRSGTVVGYAMTALLNQKAVIFSAGTRRSLGNFGGNGAVAYGVNDPGDVVGSALTANNASRAFLYRNGTMKSLGTLGGPNSTATAINNQGEITGFSWVSNIPNPHAFLFRNGVMTDLGTLGGPESTAWGLNNSGFVVGQANLAHFDSHAFLFNGGPMIDLGTLGGHNSGAMAINDAAQPQIVGYSEVAPGVSGSHAFLYQNGVMTDLNTLLSPGSGWVLESARGINNVGEITGIGTINGQLHAYLLTRPVRLRLFNVGIVDDDSNLPTGGVQVGRAVRFVTSISLLDDATAHRVVFTDSISGPVTIESVRSVRDATVCSVAGSVVTCRIPQLGELSNVASQEEVDVIVRVNAPGVFSHTAHVTADNAVPNPQDTEREENLGLALKSFTLSAAAVAGGTAVSGRVEITGPPPRGDAPIRLASSDPAIAPVPSKFAVQAPSPVRTFNIVPPVVSQPTTVTVSATYGLVTISQTLTVVPPALKTLSLTRSTMIGSCQTATAKVTLTGSAPAAGASVALSSTTTGVHVPATITVAPGAASASLTVGADAVHALTTGTFAAAFGGVTKQLPLSVRPIFLTVVTLTPSAVTGGAASSGAATIECAAPSGGLSATLASTNPAAAAPTTGSVQFAAGATKASFTVQTQHVAAVATPSIRVRVNGVTKSAPLTVQP
jgi:probable HAF family extracellular repeat protein